MKRKPPRPKSAAEETFALQLRVECIAFAREYKFHPSRRWRFDFVVYNAVHEIAVEIEGFGRHQRFTGFEDDCEKYAEALIYGYRVLRVTPRQVKSGQAIAWLKRLLEQEGK